MGGGQRIEALVDTMSGRRRTTKEDDVGVEMRKNVVETGKPANDIGAGDGGSAEVMVAPVDGGGGRGRGRDGRGGRGG